MVVHIYGQTELLLMFGKVSGEGDLKDFVDMKASQVGVEMVKEAVRDKSMPLTQNFIRQLHKVQKSAICNLLIKTAKKSFLTI